MKFRKVAVQQILRCKHCGENPEIVMGVKMLPTWGGPLLESHSATIFCKHNKRTSELKYQVASPELTGLQRNYALNYAVNLWNGYYGKK
jgi:hypothetical protein